MSKDAYIHFGSRGWMSNDAELEDEEKKVT